MNSSSGGLFGTIAAHVVSEGGVVWGAAVNGDMSVSHRRVESLDALPALFGSKYVQSDTGAVYEGVLQDLKDDKTVLFSGTPCQVAAIRRYAERLHLSEKLYLIDFICHGVPSPGVWDSYVSYIGANSPVKTVSFRDKEKRGWHDYHFKAEFENGKRIWESHERNAYMRAFISNKSLRPACHTCQFKGDEGYSSDLTLGDAWKIEKEKNEWADDKGTSVFVARSEKGKQLLSSLPEAFLYNESSYSNWCQMNPSLALATSRPAARATFFRDFSTHNTKHFWKRAKKIPFKKKMRYTAKRIVKLVGLEKKLRQRQSTKEAS